MFRSRPDSLEGLNLLDIVPRRVADWTELESKIVLDLPAPRSGWRRPMSMLSYKMATKKICLDEVGSFAWRLFDGERTVGEVAEELRQAFGEAVEPVEDRLGELVRMMHREDLIAYPGWDPPARSAVADP